MRLGDCVASPSRHKLQAERSIIRTFKNPKMSLNRISWKEFGHIGDLWGNMYPCIPLYIFITDPYIHLYTTRQMNLQHFFWLRAAASSKPASLAVGDLGCLT